MKGKTLRSRWVAYAILLLLAGESTAFTDVLADGTCRLEVGHFDVAGGGLRVVPDQPDLLPDGMPLAIYEDSDDDGRVSLADQEVVWPVSRRSLVDQALRVNGVSRLAQSGFFFVDALPLAPPAHRIYVRVWNAETQESASGSWVSPLTELRPGVQQLSFEYREWSFVANENPTALKPLSSQAANRIGCYPNPFNLQTTVTFSLEQDAAVALLLYDVQGRLVRAISDQHFSAGAHTVPFVADELGSGTYFLALNIDQRRQGMTKVLLVK